MHTLLNLRPTVIIPLIAGIGLLVVGRLRPGLGSGWFKIIEARLGVLARRRVLSAVLLGLAPIVLRLALLPVYGPPIPTVHDEFGYLFIADTLLHGRLANPPHPYPEFFESTYIIQSPTYSSYYPIGIGLTLAAGRILFHHPWGGVLLFCGLMCAGVYLMLLAWVTPGWAFLGGALTVMNMGVLSPWSNSYWGGAPAAVAGCLIFGALPRLIDCASAWNGLLLGIGLSYLALIRPFETALLGPCLLAFVLLHRDAVYAGKFRGKLALLALGLLPGIYVILLNNHAVTENWTELPYALYRYQYGVPQTFSFQTAAVPHHSLTPEQRSMYEWQLKARNSVMTAGGWLHEMPSRVDTIHLFLGAALTPVLFFLPFSLTDRRRWWALGTVMFAFLGGSVYGFFNPPYVADLIGLFLLLGIICMMRLNEVPWGRTAVRLMVSLSIVTFVAFYGFDSIRQSLPASVQRDPGLIRDLPPLSEPTARSQVIDYLQRAGQKHLVFVDYMPKHEIHREWVFNAADIDSARVVWARDLGPEKDTVLMNYYRDRDVWRVNVGSEKEPAQLFRVR